jgi:hypothetical protein
MAVVYRRFGGSIHVRCDTFAQLREAVQIPETQWVATSAPTSAFVVDATFLKYLDADGNDRIRVDELRAATAWLAARINTDAGVDARKDVLVVAHLADDQAALKAAASTVIAAVPTGASEHDKDAVTLAQVRAADAPLRERGENGDGIVAPKHLPEKVRALGEQIMGLFPETLNRAGERGLAPDTLAAFKKARDELLAHVQKKSAVFAWGDDSLARAQRIAAVKDKLDEHYLLCRLVASQPDARERFRLAADRIESLVGDRAAMAKALAALPICPPDPAGVVAFSTLYRGPSFELLSSFAKDVLTPTIGQGEQLSESVWRDLVDKADAILAWQATFDGSPVKGMVDILEGLDEDLAALEAAQRTDLARKDALQAIADLEKVILFQRYLLDFANSFLAMPDVYTNRRAMYERGWGVLAGRRYEMSVLVPDLGAHKAATQNGTTCIIYGKVEDKTGGTFEVAMPKTRGWSTELQPGKRGVFYDLKGTEYDLTVTHVVRHPVSVIEAALSPFLRIGEMVKGKLEGLNAGVDEAINKKTQAVSVRIDGATAAVSSAAKPLTDMKPAPAPAPGPAAPDPAPAAAAAVAPGGMGNALAMGGLAVAAVGSSVAFIANQLKALTLGDVLSIILVGFLAVALPSGFVGWLKLRRRNIAELLEGAGWALNDRLRLTPNLTARITQTPSRVAGSSLELMATPAAPGEPEASSTAWKILGVVVVLLVALWQFRAPLVKAGCHTGRLPDVVCAVADAKPEPAPVPTP